MVERQPCANLPVYGEGCSCTLDSNYLLSISNNLEQIECKDSVEGVGPGNEPTFMPQQEDALPVNHLTESQLQGIPNSPSK